MRLAIEVVTIYAVYVFGTSLLVWRFGTRGNGRGPSIVVAAVAPALFVVGLLELMFLVAMGRRPRIDPCPDGLDEAELIVEAKRQEMFGGEPIKPHFASDWAKLYSKTVEHEAERVQAFARRVLSVA
jgi:hypothetical protein